MMSSTEQDVAQTDPSLTPLAGKRDPTPCPPGFICDEDGNVVGVAGDGTGDGDGDGTKSSSGPAPYDPDKPLIASATQVYFQLWGVYPPDGYIKGLVSQGMNIFEIADFERHKPAWLKSEAARKGVDGFAKMLHDAGVV